MAAFVDFNQPTFWLSAATIIFNPTFWNIAARQGTAILSSPLTLRARAWGSSPDLPKTQPMEVRESVELQQNPNLIASIPVTLLEPTNPQMQERKADNRSPAAQAEYHNKVITKLFGGNSLYGCYALAVTIFTLGIVRDAIYKSALEAQPPHPLLQTPASNYTAYALLAAGNTLVLTSMYALGVTGTYLGDYFGILMDAPVTSFPFNVTGSPMYWGSTMSFLGTALLFGRPAGVVLTALVYVAYSIALRYEDPFTAEIYAKRERERKAQGGKKSS
ncbi:Phospholipid methyltransferase [Botryosphaeria dothidea]|uniref:Phosphatidyl-N-methylethanolamine N-methyltransferase n=1 Tax=Botryosphaeria dothidea TaxID=55169 RepID=A0A8H4IYW0_9PEZI|nr:Phospholipid methyltransferase [Botryosphaeria dothidea]